MPLDRRSFLHSSAKLGGGAVLAPSLLGLAACVQPRGAARTSPMVSSAPGYGEPKQSVEAPELFVPAGFRVARLSRTTQPSLADPAFIVPQALDGMACFAMPDGRLRLVRNHEMRDPAAAVVPLSAAGAYDMKGGGGTTTLELTQGEDGSVRLLREFVSLSGTHVNCAGGLTPWRTWITCEETTVGPAAGYEQPHGYCFEVPVDGDGVTAAVPLKAMGRISHEAVAVDPATDIVYLTEDRSWVADQPGSGSGFYRFLASRRRQLAAGGRLQMLAVGGQPGYLTMQGQQRGTVLRTRWVDIADPDPATAEAEMGAVFQQGLALGGAVFQRLEGCWYGDGGIFFNATSGGDAKAGQVWFFRPTGADAGELVLIFESPSPKIMDSPDNICVSPRGGIVICEDGSGVQFLHGLTTAGDRFDFIHTSTRSTEFCGACFSPDGRTLFVNTQGSTSRTGTAIGATYAVWGPWERGAL